MTRNVCVAAIQMPCNIDKTINVNKAKELVIEASKSGYIYYYTDTSKKYTFR